MTIKRQIFLSNVRMVAITFVTFGLAGNIIMFLFRGKLRSNQELVAQLRDTYNHDTLTLIWILGIVLFVILISALNNFVTYRMTKRIVKPLQPLTEGVRQIQNNNFSYRIDYQEDDEFRQVCEAFDEMAAKLEASSAQREKDEANRRELIAGISHDLRTPLTSVIGCIEGLETGVAATPEMREQYLAYTKSKAISMKGIIEKLFLFSKLDMDDFPITLRSVDISPAVCDMIEESSAEYASRGLDIQFTEMPDNIHVSADVIMLRNVIVNILENSVKYKTKETGKMKISVSAADGSALIRLSDDGPGVEPDSLVKIFDVFYRTDPSRTDSGSGLGLAISKKIIQRMCGSIYAETPPAGGLSIIIKLPSGETS